MRKIGIKNLNGKNCKWLGDSAEKISVSDNSISSVWFGSSFNLVDHPKVFAEFNRYSRPRAWITCLWNHRNLTDPLQKEIENILKLKIRDFDYGLRRKDPTLLMKDSGLLGGITKFETDFHVQVETKEWIKAWSSHATLRRQCKDETQFQNILREISRSVQNFDSLLIPYTTRAWTGQLLNNMKI
jgi:hypothetical protein